MTWKSWVYACLSFSLSVSCSLAQTAGAKRVPFVGDEGAFARVASSVLASSDWGVETSPALGASSVSRSDIDDFVMKYLGLNENEGSVCSVTFADLGNDGSYWLIASLDYSGRRFCNTVLVVSKDSAGFKSATLEAWWPGDVSKAVKDSAGDGRKELLVQQSLSPYEGAKCIATWLRVFQIRDDELADVSSEFPNFYAAALKEIRRDLAAKPEDSVCRQIEMDKIERVMGTKPDAGYARAIEWMKSGDPNLRMKAVYVLSNIADQKSIEALSNAMHDKDAGVSTAAKIWFGQLVSE